MRRSWRFGSQEIVFKQDLQEGETSHPAFLGANLLTDPFARRGLSDLFRALKGSAPGDLTSPSVAQMVMRTIQQAITGGQLVAVKLKGGSDITDKVSGGGGSSPPPPPPRRRSAAPPPREDTPPEKTWVEIQLLDPDGNPVPNAKYKLKITDGSVREGTLNDEGKARVNGIDPGNCTVWFPDYDAKEWRPTK